MVKCNQCGWSGEEEDLVMCSEPGSDAEPVQHFTGCPQCKTDEALMDVA